MKEREKYLKKETMKYKQISTYLKDHAALKYKPRKDKINDKTNKINNINDINDISRTNIINEIKDINDNNNINRTNIINNIIRTNIITTS
jgi:hypothetical protein